MQFAAPQRRVWDQARGLSFIQGDFLKLQFVVRFDLVICNQVVEHLPDGVVQPFVAKMMRTSRVLIVSTTYMLPMVLSTGTSKTRSRSSSFVRGLRQERDPSSTTGMVRLARTRRHPAGCRRLG